MKAITFSLRSVVLWTRPHGGRVHHRHVAVETSYDRVLSSFTF